MGKTFNVAFPCIILAISILMQGGNLMGQTTNVCYNITQVQCTVASGGQAVLSCPGYPSTTACQLPANCNNPYPAPAFCVAGLQFLPPGTSIVTQVTQQANNGLFSFGAIGSAGVIAMVGVAVAVSVLSGVSILGSGLNQESIRILFMGGLLTGVYLFLAGLEGFINGGTGSFFAQLNTATNSVGIPFGSVGFIVMSMVELWGISGYVSGGGED